MIWLTRIIPARTQRISYGSPLIAEQIRIMGRIDVKGLFLFEYG